MDIKNLHLLAKIANSLDQKGLYKEAEILDEIIIQIAKEEPFHIHIINSEDAGDIEETMEEEDADAVLVFEKE